jgi:hypothetical protein
MVHEEHYEKKKKKKDLLEEMKTKIKREKKRKSSEIGHDLLWPTCGSPSHAQIKTRVQSCTHARSTDKPGNFSFFFEFH